MHVRSPEWLNAPRAPGAPVFALLFTGDATVRSLLATVIPLQALALLAFFWFLRVTEPELVIPASRPPRQPLANIGRFWRQPRLRLAWSVAVGRSAWWGMFFVYGPIFVVSNGLDEVTAGLVVSAGNGVLFLAPVVVWLSRRTGVRRVIVTAFAVGGACSAAVGLCSGRPWLGVGLPVTAALCAAALDAVGNIPFLRSVRRHERAEMTSVFSTYRDIGELLPPGVFSVLLELFRLPAVFFAGGGAMLVFAALSRSLPRRL